MARQPLCIEASQRNRIVNDHLQEVRQIAKQIHVRLPSHVQLEDLISEGSLGLLDAVNKFDPSKNVPLRAYARFRIRGAILDSLRGMDWCPRILRREARRIDKARRDLELQLGRAPGQEELALKLGVSLDNLWNLLRQLHEASLSSLDQEAQRSAYANESVGGFVKKNQEDPYFKYVDKETESMVRKALLSLGKRPQQVLTLYYLRELTMKEVGVVLGLGESRVSQIHGEALESLRDLVEQERRRPA